MTQRKPSECGVVEFWAKGNNIFVARDNYNSAEFSAAPDKTIKASAYEALGRFEGDIQKEILG